MQRLICLLFNSSSTYNWLFCCYSPGAINHQITNKRSKGERRSDEPISPLMQLWGGCWAPGGVQSSLPALAEGDRSRGVHATEERFTLLAAETEGAMRRTLKSPSFPAKVFSPTLPSIAFNSRFKGNWILQSSLSCEMVSDLSTYVAPH